MKSASSTTVAACCWPRAEAEIGTGRTTATDKGTDRESERQTDKQTDGQKERERESTSDPS